MAVLQPTPPSATSPLASGASTPRGLAVTSGSFYLGGGVTALLVTWGAVGFGTPEGRFLTVVAALALTVGAVLLAWRRPLPEPVWHVVVAAGTGLVAVAVVVCPDEASAVALSTVFTFIAIDAFCFFRVREAVAQLSLLVAASTTSLLSHADVGLGTAAGVAVVLACIAFVVGRLVATASGATRDPLTGLLNRRGFDRAYEELLSTAERTRAPLSLALIDVDDFKAVNDGLGHAAGDELLRGLAAGFLTALPAPAVVARCGGDEFLVLLPGLTGERALEVVDGLRLPGGDATLSCGIAELAAGESGADLLRRADTAMYAAKRGGRDRSSLADAGSPSLALDLAHAVRAGDVAVVLQPILRLSDRTVIGVEALARWTHPVRGPVSPAEFIPVAEAAGLIDELGLAVLAQACRDTSLLGEAWGLPLLLTVNVSGRQLVAPGFAARALSVLAATGWSPAALVVEVTESLLDATTAAATNSLKELRDAGVAVAIDDFGTGYSALSRLDTVPVDVVKLDADFIAHITTSPRRAAVLRAVLDLCSSLGLAVVAEGVERADQAELLRQLGCPLAQGYLFHRPLPVADLVRRDPGNLPPVPASVPGHREVLVVLQGPPRPAPGEARRGEGLHDRVARDDDPGPR
ncbi:bifunctional diguanylate cyclase/phosphodiesterase [Kineosporiaceae bacterium B12]|nr:bifunctional diguanylate cyclase/phosphodiesterase [Kineococcus rubinsiae]